MKKEINLKSFKNFLNRDEMRNVFGGTDVLEDEHKGWCKCTGGGVGRGAQGGVDTCEECASICAEKRFPTWICSV